MKFINFSIVKFSAFLVLGILASRFFPISLFLWPYLLVLLAGVSVLWFWAQNQLIQKIYFGVAIYLSFFSIGYLGYQMRSPEFQPEHYTHITSGEKAEMVQLKISQSLKPDKFNLKYLANVIAIDGESSEGKILLQVSKDSLQNIPRADEVLLVYARIAEIPPALNPYQFDYAQYMKTLEVYGQLKISHKEILKISKGTPTLTGVAQNLRASIIAKLQKTKLKKNERAIIQALVLGEKRDIDKALYDSYAAAGAVHILAVSGLHVAILYAILLFLFKPITRWKYGKHSNAVLIVVLLWGFAVLSGLSPSVSRAVTMFSFFALAKLLDRETNSINTLFLSFLALLIINPLWLFQVGFQLSYLAVFFIVWLQPHLFKLAYSKYWILRKVWAIISVTLCAQIGVLPLSLYYFHQFPGLFLLTNIIVLPVLTFIMCGGILIVALAVLNSLPDWLAESYNILIEGLNSFIQWIAVQDAFLFKNIHFSILKTIILYVLIIAITFLLKKVKYSRLLVTLFAVALFCIVYIYEESRINHNQFLVFQKSKSTVIGYKNGKELKLFKNDSSVKSCDKYPITGYKTALGINSCAEEVLPKIFQYKRKKILVIDSFGIVPRQKKIHILVLVNSPKINLNRVIDSLNPEQIVADGSNYHSYVRRWEVTSKIKKLPFHHTAKQGAFSMK